MARSTYVYVVLQYDSSDRITCIAATFTVKHEMINWLQRQPFEEFLHVFRCGDNWGYNEHPPAEIPKSELFPKYNR